MNILITAGPTREPLDPVRYLTNRSSGKMGYAIAGAAAHEGHRVLLISGPTSLDVPDGIDFIPVETAAEMYEAVANHIGRMDAAVFAAAVADYTPVHVAVEKIKKSGETLTLELVKTSDILGSARREMRFGGFLVGFAAETENLEENARAKLERKGCNLVVANDVSRSDIGFDSEDNEALLVFPDHTEAFAKASKYELAMRVVQLVEGGNS
jgi:phosphopantothenoylcysteine decarboxylase/phosphopantothenate--cysteine ligase